MIEQDSFFCFDGGGSHDGIPLKQEVRVSVFPPTNGTETSQEAAQAIAPAAGSLRDRVYAYIVARGESGATRDEISEALGLDGNTVRPRIAELMGYGGLPVLVHGRGSRPNRRGKRCAVVVAS